MNFERLVTFGCSLTYGHGLEDCHIEPHFPGLEPSKFAWPTILAEKLKVKCVNNSYPGSSNLEILLSILKFNFLPNDLVIILWTNELRSSYFYINEHTKEVCFHQLGTWQFPYQDIVDNWLKANDDLNLLFQSLILIHHGEQYLERNKIKNYSFYTSNKLFQENRLKFLKIKNTPNEDISTIMWNFDRALDKGHPGPIAHIKMSEFILKNIKERNS